MTSASGGGINGCIYWHLITDSNSGLAEQVEYEAKVSPIHAGTALSLPR